MRLFLMTTLTMVAFAANSVLNRLALADGAIDPISFGSIRLASGAAMLVVLVVLTGGSLRLGGAGRWISVGSLLLYIYGFSLAYTSLDAGLGALVLFGVVQITMFGGALRGGDRVPFSRWIGAGLAFGGLAWLLWPGEAFSISPLYAALMAAAGLGWGIYSLAGRGASDPLGATAANFVWAALGGGAAFSLMPLGVVSAHVSVSGVALAIVSGALTSGLGYALWYRLLPTLGASLAAVAQLTVPVIATAGGLVFLSEVLSTRFVICSLLVLGGVALSVLAPQKVSNSKGS